MISNNYNINKDKLNYFRSFQNLPQKNRINKKLKKNALFLGSLHNLEKNKTFSNFSKLKEIKIFFYIKKKDKSLFNNLKNNNSKMMAYIDSPKIMQSKISNYKFGILSYPINSINNDYCAPLKIENYLSSNLILISLFKNKSLLSFKKRYNNLIYFVEDIKSFSTLNLDKNYLSDKSKYFKDLNDDVQTFLKKIK